jgi:hypothetical protein
MGRCDRQPICGGKPATGEGAGKLVSQVSIMLPRTAFLPSSWSTMRGTSFSPSPGDRMNDPNPYKPPRADLTTGTDRSALLDLNPKEVEAFVGRNAGYYLKKWPLARELTGTSTGFNWAAFLFTGMWLPYRKMYWATTILWGAILVESIVEELVFVLILHKPEPPTGLTQLVGLVAAGICGTCGNQWYLSHTRRVVAEVRGLGLSEADYLRALSRRGGTNLGASFGFLTLVIITIVGALFVLELLIEGN